MTGKRPAGDSTCLAAVLAAASMWGLFHCAPPKEVPLDAAVKDGPEVVARDPARNTRQVPINKVIRITFSDHLDTQSFHQNLFRLSSGPVSYWLRFYYNPVRKQLVVWPTRNIRRNMLWIFRIEEGIYDIDGNPRAAGPVTRFYTGNDIAAETAFATPSFEGDVLPIFRQKCASCHGGPGGSEIAGIRLDSAESVNSTAVDRKSSGWPDWELIKSSDPGRSYLLFKIIGDRRIAGMPMPRAEDFSSAYHPLTIEEQDTIAHWIVSGTPFVDP